MRVRIVEDVRDGSPATGALGTYEGMLPLTVALNAFGTWYPGEYEYDRYESGELKAANGEPVKELFPLWQGGKKPDRFALALKNPRIRLDDGTTIWGAECWWEPVRGAPSLEESQEELQDFKRFLLARYGQVGDEFSVDDPRKYELNDDKQE